MVEKNKAYKPKILHRGCDGITVAFMGKVSQKGLDLLESEKAMAVSLGQDTSFQANGVTFVMMEKGTSYKQGYAFQFHTGRDGIKYQVKRSGDASQWNLRARVSALFLAHNGFDVARDRLFSDLRAIGAIIIDQSPSNVDFCIDLQMDKENEKNSGKFRLNPDAFIHHSKSKKRQFTSDDNNGLQIIGGRYIETVTIGSKGNRQLCVYNKRTEQIATQREDWFGVWGVSKETSPSVWRIEFRFGKKFLKDWNIHSLQDIADSYGDLIQDSLQAIRYISFNGDSNLSRCPNAPFWDYVKDAFESLCVNAVSGLSRGRITDIQRSDAKRMYEAQILGNIAALSHVLKIESTDSAIEKLPDEIAQLIRRHISYNPKKFEQSRKRAADRLRFIHEKE